MGNMTFTTAREILSTMWIISSIGRNEKESDFMAKEVPIWEKFNLTLEEAAAYSGIGINKLRRLSDEKNCPFVLWNGSKRLIKRKALDSYIEKQYSL